MGPSSAANPPMMAARSRHPGGVNACLGDVSVRFVPDSVDLKAWRAMSTARGGEAVTTYLDARLPNGEDIDRASCIAALSRRRAAR